VEKLKTVSKPCTGLLQIEAKKYGIRMVVPKEEGAGALVRALEPLIVAAVDSLADTVVESRVSAIESQTGTAEASCTAEPIPKSN
jgi:hypothetical protein